MNNSTIVNKNKIFGKLLFENIFIYFSFSLTIFLLFLVSIRNFNSYSTIFTFSLFVFVLIPFYKLFYDYNRYSSIKTPIGLTFFLNILFSLLSGWQSVFCYNNYQTLWRYDGPAFFFWMYFAIGSGLIYWKYNKIIISFSKNFLPRLFNGTKSLLKGIYKTSIKLTLVPALLNFYSVRRLNNNYHAVFFAKKFIIIQSTAIKNILPGTMPETISQSIKTIFKNDLDRLQQLFKFNHIKSYSKTATLNFVMKTANPIIKDLQLTLEQHLTEELLKDNNNSKNLQINVDNLWKKVEKTMIQWESTFTDSELSYKDTLLHK
jgi:hypothetical protein